ncbi:hypothetical protein ULO1_07480 [Carboxydocella sp. ULO1]|nr:hypothetical protein ULO1_07480 [Carboxydocella sp. ULO1]
MIKDSRPPANQSPIAKKKMETSQSLDTIYTPFQLKFKKRESTDRLWEQPGGAMYFMLFF